MNSIETARKLLFGSLSGKGLEFDGQKLPDEDQLRLLAQAKKNLPNEEGESRIEEGTSINVQN